MDGESEILNEREKEGWRETEKEKRDRQALKSWHKIGFICHVQLLTPLKRISKCFYVKEYSYYPYFF